MLIRSELIKDINAIRLLVMNAFKSETNSPQEHLMIDTLRNNNALFLSLVAEENGEIVGHIAFSAVWINSRLQGWYGLAPLAVHPDHQGLGIGKALVREGLLQLIRLGAEGCVVLGNPVYYSQFGFIIHPTLYLEGVPPEYFMVQSFRGDGKFPSGVVAYHEAFGLTASESSVKNSDPQR